MTAGYGVSKSQAYPSLLEKKIRKNYPDYKVVNAGSSGSTTASAVPRMKWHLKVQPKILILALGGNDGLRGFPIKTTRDNLSKAIDLALSKKITVYLAGMLLPTNYGEEYRTQFKNIFSQLANEKKIKLIPFLLKGVGGNSKLNLADGIHPNEEGHKIVAETVFQSIKGDL